MPMAVRFAPGIGCAFSPIFSMWRTTASICSGRAPASITTSIGFLWASIIHGLMKKILSLAAVCVLFCANAFATYIVVLKNGAIYKAKSKWTVVNGKAMIALESGQTLQLDPSLIDEPASEKQTKSGLG